MKTYIAYDLYHNKWLERTEQELYDAWYNKKKEKYGDFITVITLGSDGLYVMNEYHPRNEQEWKHYKGNLIKLIFTIKENETNKKN